ncbi:hypothetical protein [Neolewinella agarilytica]|uniref:Uncharacterized protein n=2 Tax=Neolewinella agarilytica TaxID=478744 RepID=A0A1H9CGT8_9BACT|nr:hypothetical protein [Neolewinella agarilytica]SEP99953.1 hypothetical protein SAMN05444359_104179 [Neolewinella agarilytica]
MYRPWFSLLFIPLLAPACAPAENTVEEVLPVRHVVILTDTLQNGHLIAGFRDSLTEAGNRVLISGYPGETAEAITARLPWLLQPGVDLFIYDQKLAGKPGEDSLRNYLDRMAHPAEVISL